MASKKDKGVLGVLLLAGVGVGGYFLYKYFKEDTGVIDPTGFIISKISITQEGEEVQFPKRGTEFDISIIARNKGDENINGYCEIINPDTKETVFYEEAMDVPSMQVHTFTHTTIMPGTILNLITETGRIVNSEKVKDYSWPIKITSQELTILGVGVETG